MTRFYFHSLASLVFLFVISSSTAQVYAPISSYPGTLTDACIAFSVGDYGYIGGGTGRKDLWMYNPTTDTWTQKSDMPGVESYRSFAVAAVAGDKAYFGTGADNGELLSDWYMYDPATDTYEQKADFPGGPRNAAMAFSIDDMIYVGAGSDNDFIYSYFYRYDPLTDSWTELNYLPGFTNSPTVFVLDGFAYLVCGNIDQDGNPTNECFRYDPETDSWTDIADFPGEPFMAGTAFSDGNFGYAGFGTYGFFDLHNELYRYNPMNDSWIQIVNDVIPDFAWTISFVIEYKAFLGTGVTSYSPFSFSNDMYRIEMEGLATPVEKEYNSGLTLYYDRKTEELLISNYGPISALAITDLRGRTCMYQLFNGSMPTMKISAGDLAAGTYIATVSDQMNNPTSFRFVKD